MERLLILNPGSTSTKLAVFDAETALFTESIVHTPEELAPFDCVADQYGFRRDVVLRCLSQHGIPLESLTAIVSRGGLLPPIHAGAYAINEDMQAEAIEKLMASLEEITEQSIQNAQNAQSANELSQSIKGDAEAGNLQMSAMRTSSPGTPRFARSTTAAR